MKLNGSFSLSAFLHGHLCSSYLPRCVTGKFFFPFFFFLSLMNNNYIQTTTVTNTENKCGWGWREGQEWGWGHEQWGSRVPTTSWQHDDYDRKGMGTQIQKVPEQWNTVSSFGPQVGSFFSLFYLFYWLLTTIRLHVSLSPPPTAQLRRQWARVEGEQEYTSVLYDWSFSFCCLLPFASVQIFWELIGLFFI